MPTAAAAVGVTVAGAGATAAPPSPRSMLTAPEMSPVPPSSLDSLIFGLGAAAGRTLLRLKRCGRRRMRRSAWSDLRRGAGAGLLALASWW